VITRRPVERLRPAPAPPHPLARLRLPALLLAGGTASVTVGQVLSAAILGLL
jgi:hypothetical protein